MDGFTHRFEVDASQDGPRLAVKCSIDVEGLVSHAGNQALAEIGEPASADAPIVAQARAAGAIVVGHPVMPEFGLNATGINEVMGTPTNPLDPERVPGGSSSGSAVAVANGEADVAYGTDAGGSCRMPPACCGVVGLKSTQDRFPLDGVGVLARSMDVVGPLARDVAGVVLGVTWMEPGFEVAERPAHRIGRLHVRDVEPHIEAAIDGALERVAEASPIEVVSFDVDDLGSWQDAYNAGGIALVDEGWQEHRDLLERHPEGFTRAGADKLRVGSYIDDEKRAWVTQTRSRFRAALAELFERVDVLALPTIAITPPRVAEVEPRHDVELSRLTIPFNLSGHPAIAMPVPTPGHPIPASLQLVAPLHAEELLLATALAVESALTTH